MRLAGARFAVFLAVRFLAEDFFTELNRIVLDNEVVVETVAPSDESVHAVYDYLIGDGTGGGTT